jgi:enolase
MSKIKNIKARQIFDSRGNPTVEVDVITDDNSLGRSAVPSGASTGEHEAVELRDGGTDYMGKGVKTAVNNVNSVIKENLLGKSVFDQQELDNLMIDIDGTENKCILGANAILGVSLAISQAAAKSKNMPLYEYVGGNSALTLPVPMMNIINGGSHSDAPIAFQEFMIVPHNATSFSDAMKIGTEVFHNLKSIISNRGLSTSVGDEGGFAPKLKGTEDALETIIKSISSAGLKAGDDVMIALDCASSEFFENNHYDYSKFEGKNGKILNSEQQADYLADLVNAYPIISIEDGMDQNDWDGWIHSTQILGDKVQLVGDDLFVTNSNILQKGIDTKAANSILIKVNQIGTLTETINAVNLAKKNGFSTVISHRSGETEDNIIADLAVALNAGQIKTGSLSRSDRMSKYNQLLRIEEQLGSKAFYPKREAFTF